MRRGSCAGSQGLGILNASGTSAARGVGAAVPCARAGARGRGSPCAPLHVISTAGAGEHDGCDGVRRGLCRGAHTRHAYARAKAADGGCSLLLVLRLCSGGGGDSGYTGVLKRFAAGDPDGACVPSGPAAVEAAAAPTGSAHAYAGRSGGHWAGGGAGGGEGRATKRCMASSRRTLGQHAAKAVWSRPSSSSLEIHPRRRAYGVDLCHASRSKLNSPGGMYPLSV
jgi:hypothetical protein